MFCVIVYARAYTTRDTIKPRARFQLLFIHIYLFTFIYSHLFIHIHCYFTLIIFHFPKNVVLRLVYSVYERKFMKLECVKIYEGVRCNKHRTWI